MKRGRKKPAKKERREAQMKAGKNSMAVVLAVVLSQVDWSMRG